MESGLTQIQI